MIRIHKSSDFFYIFYICIPPIAYHRTRHDQPVISAAFVAGIQEKVSVVSIRVVSVCDQLVVIAIRAASETVLQNIGIGAIALEPIYEHECAL